MRNRVMIEILLSIISIILISFVFSNAISNTSSINPPSDSVYQNPRKDTFKDNIMNFGFILVGLLILVLAKSIFDYLRVKNQSLLINW